VLTHDELVEVSVKSHDNGALNPNAQHRRQVSPDEVRGARMIADPLTLLMCSSICDGAAALVVARKGAVPDRGRCSVRVRASQGASGFTPDPDGEPGMSELCAQAAYDEAGVGPAQARIADANLVIELPHDDTSTADHARSA
jgi:acetyl-CoA acetyltransferase